MNSKRASAFAIIASVKKGIFCDLFSNGQVNIGAGDFTFYVKNGSMIEDGKITRPIKAVNIIGNGPKVLELIDMVADDLKIYEGGWTCGKTAGPCRYRRDCRRCASRRSRSAAAREEGIGDGENHRSPHRSRAISSRTGW